MKISHKPTKHGKILSLVFEDENEYEKLIAVIKADIDYIHKNYENGEKLTEYIEEIYEKLQKRYTISPRYNDGKPSTFLFDNDWVRIHFDYFFNMVFFLQELIAENEKQDSLIKTLMEINQGQEIIISQKEQINSNREKIKSQHEEIISQLKEIIKEKNELIETLLELIEEKFDLQEEDKLIINSIKESIKYDDK